MRSRSANPDIDEAQVDRFSAWLTDLWLENDREVHRYVEPTVQLLIQEGYSAASALGLGFHLIGLCSNHLLLGYVAKGNWPSGVCLELFETAPAPRGTRKIIFLYRNPRMIPDRGKYDCAHKRCSSRELAGTASGGASRVATTASDSANLRTDLP
jgi:hypothetical protein